MAEIASLYAKVGASTTDFEKGMKSVNESLNKLAGKGFDGVTKAFSNMAKAGTVAFAALIGGSAAGIIGATTKFAQFEQSIADTTAALGLTSKEAAQLESLVNTLAIDPRLVVSAEEANQAISLLGRNGLSWKEIADGAARSTVLLANATGADYALSADIATSAMQMFGLQATDLDGMVSKITGTLTSSKFGMQDYALALSQGGGVAAATGVSFDEFNSTIAAISSYFGSGSDAGTSFKVMLQRLIPQSNDAKDAMMQLGLMTEEGTNQFFDQAGQLKSMDSIFAMMRNSLVGLSEEQRLNALSTIFGTDAMRAAAAMVDVGREGYLRYTETIAKSNAEAQAAIRTDTLNAKWQNLIDTMDAMVVQIGSRFEPAARKILDWAKSMVDKWQPKILDWFGQVGEGVDGLVDQFIAGWPRLEGWFETLGGRIAEIVEKVQTRWPGIQETITQVWENIRPTVQIMTDKFGAMWDALGSGNSEDPLLRFAQFSTAIVVQLKQVGEFLGKTMQMFELAGKTVGAFIRGDWAGAAQFGAQTAELVKFLTFEGVTEESVKAEVDKILNSVNIRSNASGNGAVLNSGEYLEPAANENRRIGDNVLSWAAFKVQRHGQNIGDLIREWHMLPKAAMGGFRGGLTWVGERGPELVDLPRGSYVHSNMESQRMTQQGSNITIQNLNIQGGSNGLTNLASTVTFLNALYG